MYNTNGIIIMNLLTGVCVSLVQRVSQQKGRIELASIRAVEYVDTSAFHLAHTLQVNTRTYISR